VPAHGWLTVPNLLSFLRLGLVPVFVWLMLAGRPEWALTVFVFASVSDALDGFLARVLDQRSKVGAILDPVADKLLGFTALLMLVATGLLPLWLLLLLLVRDGTMLLGAIAVRRKGLELPSTPSRIGKYATLTLFATIVLALAAASPHAPPELLGWVMAVGALAGLCVVLSYLQYSARFGYLFFAPGRSEPSAEDERTTPR
jgi:cardiolipin synthase (CMP-forming)